MESVEKIAEIKAKVEDELLQRPGVTGVDVGYKYVGGKKTDEIYVFVGTLGAIVRDNVTHDPMLLSNFQLSAALGLDFAGIDLKLTDEGEVYCFEVNPCPAFSYYEHSTGQPIAHAIACYLADRDP